jgi:hypothetical protein
VAIFSPGGAAQLALEFELTDHDGYVELFPIEKFVVRRKVPFSYGIGSSEKVQIVGVGNPRSTFTILTLDDGLNAQLNALWQQQLRGRLDLTDDFGNPTAFWDNVLLVDVGKAKRQPWSTSWRIPVTFEQVV